MCLLYSLIPGERQAAPGVVQIPEQIGSVEVAYNIPAIPTFKEDTDNGFNVGRQISKRIVEDIHMGFHPLICCANLTLIR